MRLLSYAELKEQRERYIDKRIRMIAMHQDPHPIAPGAEGTCIMVDDIGQLIVFWDNGRTLSLIPGVDEFEIIE